MKIKQSQSNCSKCYFSIVVIGQSKKVNKSLCNKANIYSFQSVYKLQ